MSSHEKRSKLLNSELGENGFSEVYWKENYDVPSEMDGIVNAAQHARYLKSFFDVEFVDINSIIDFGFGLGFLYSEILKEFNPYKTWGLEPSPFAFETVRERGLPKCSTTQLTLKNWSLEKWATHAANRNQKWFDLGICTSVFQYLTEDSLKVIIPEMSRRVKFLYFSVPTDLELKRQVKELGFKDRFALRRSKSFYIKLLKPHFTIVGNRVLESKVHFDEDSSSFTDYLFRF